ncbi:hypothetical protein P5673_002325 [Acropora cervicornis]|uniref:Uncharacterized protein n=1 Tax=Acropora cervicornis TaxID=6130 RepID=A0AAD9VFL8_ACRCE|nr:hypothetical protein P5673_002325 [Acropora cervicornis]
MVGVFLEVVFIFVFAWTNFVANESETYLTEVKHGHATIKCEEKDSKRSGLLLTYVCINDCEEAADRVVFGMIPEMWLLPIRILSVELLKNC